MCDWRMGGTSGCPGVLARTGSLPVNAQILVLRLASACALQDAWVVLVCLWWPIGPALIWNLSVLLWWLVRPALVLGCLTLQGPLGLVLGFYHVRVRCLDVAHLNCEGGLGANSPCFIRVFSNGVRRLQGCGMLCSTMSLGLHFFTRQL